MPVDSGTDYAFGDVQPRLRHRRPPRRQPEEIVWGLIRWGADHGGVGALVARCAKEYLAIIRVRDGALTLTTMLFADEVRPTKDIDATTQRSDEPSPREVDVAAAVIEELSTDWRPEKHEDCYRVRLREVVERKRQGKTVKLPSEAQEPAPAPDQTAALERTPEELRQRTRTSS
jgi:DNA end-binding protein Ku